jgi:hypothetical protein
MSGTTPGSQASCLSKTPVLYAKAMGRHSSGWHCPRLLPWKPGTAHVNKYEVTETPVNTEPGMRGPAPTIRSDYSISIRSASQGDEVASCEARCHVRELPRDVPIERSVPDARIVVLWHSLV